MSEQIIEQIFEMTETEIEPYTAEFIEFLNPLRKKMGHADAEKMYSIVLDAIYEAKQAGFKAGWQMRSQL